MPDGTLYLVPTPLGNLGDMTLRAIETLKQADVIACEDTRRTLGLLNHLGISKPLWSYHAHSPGRRPQQLLNALAAGKKVALVCDAGTPGISDPGTFLVQAALEAGVPVVSLPGPCAAITALVASGLPTDRFFFIGFLPRRTSRARRMLEQAAATESTVVVYESPFRTLDTLKLIEEVAGPDSPVVVSRELTKIHEEIVRGTAREVLSALEGRTLKGEVVLSFHPVVIPRGR
jgi:16S rRNA (cytidine1402-2'-O)-methyltransferase